MVLAEDVFNVFTVEAVVSVDEPSDTETVVTEGFFSSEIHVNLQNYLYPR